MTAPEITLPVEQPTPVEHSTVTPPEMPVANTEPPAPPVAELNPDPPIEDSLGDLEVTRKKGRENKNLRDRLQAADTDLAAARAELDVLRRQAVERLVAGELRDVRDFNDRHPDPAEFLGEDGQLDAAAVLLAAQSLASERPHYAAPLPMTPPPSIRPVESLRSGAGRDQPTPPASWGTVLRRSAGQG